MFWRYVAIGFLAATAEVIHALFGIDSDVRQLFHLVADITRPWR